MDKHSQLQLLFVFIPTSSLETTLKDSYRIKLIIHAILTNTLSMFGFLIQVFNYLKFLICQSSFVGFVKTIEMLLHMLNTG